MSRPPARQAPPRRVGRTPALPVGVSYWVGETGITTMDVGVTQTLGKSIATTPTNAKRWAHRCRMDPNSTLHIWGAREGQAPQYLGSNGKETGREWAKIKGVVKELPMGGSLSKVQILRAE